MVASIISFTYIRVTEPSYLAHYVVVRENGFFAMFYMSNERL